MCQSGTWDLKRIGCMQVLCTRVAPRFKEFRPLPPETELVGRVVMDSEVGMNPVGNRSWAPTDGHYEPVAAPQVVCSSLLLGLCRPFVILQQATAVFVLGRSPAKAM